MKIGKKIVNKGYLPKQLDVLWMKCEPHIGREAGSHNSKDKQHNYRPFIVISNDSFNADWIVETYPVTYQQIFTPVVSALFSKVKD